MPLSWSAYDTKRLDLQIDQFLGEGQFFPLMGNADDGGAKERILQLREAINQELQKKNIQPMRLGTESERHVSYYDQEKALSNFLFTLKHVKHLDISLVSCERYFNCY